MKKSIALFLSSSMLFFQLSAYSQTAEMEGLEYLAFMEMPEVTTATMTAKSTITAPSTMTAFTAEDIKSMGSRTLMELLEKVPGMIVRLKHTGGQGIGLRGIQTYSSCDKYKMLVNGHAINPPLYADFSDSYDMSLENVKQVEIVKGPGSALYGTNAFAGIINVMTYKPEEVKGLKVDGKYGSYDTVFGDLSLAKVFDNESQLSINVNRQQSNGADLKVERDGLYGTPFSIASTRGMDEDYDRTQYSAEYIYKDFSFYASYMDLTVPYPVPIVGIMTQEGGDKDMEYGYMEANYNFHISDLTSLKTTLSYDSYKHEEYTQEYPYGFTLGRDLNGDGMIEYWPTGAFAGYGHKSRNYDAKVVLDTKITEKNELLVGAFYEYSELYDSYMITNAHPVYGYSLGRMTDITAYSNWIQNHPDPDRDIYGLFFQDEWNMTDEWYMILGGRYDEYNDFGSTFNPRCGLVWDFNQKGGVAKLLYGTAFKAPNFSQLYITNNTVAVGNEDLDPEKIKSVELALNYIFAEKLDTGISLYYLKAEDLIDISTTRNYSLPGYPRVYVNHGEQEVTGVELNFKYAFQKNTNIYGSYCYSDAQDELLDRDVPLTPDHLFTLGANWEIVEHLKWNINADYTSKLEREAGDPRDDLDATTIWDSTLRLEGIAGFDFYFSVYNIFDEDMYTPSVLSDLPLTDTPRPGTTYCGGVTYRY